MDMETSKENQGSDLVEEVKKIIGAPTPVVLPSTQTTVQIKLLTLRTLPSVVAALSDVFSSVAEKMPEGTFATDKIVESSFMRGIMLALPAVAPHLHKVYEGIATLSSLSVEELQDLPMDDAVFVILKVVEVNRDFFLERVLPVLEASLPKV